MNDNTEQMNITPIPVVIIAEPEPCVVLTEPVASNFSGGGTYLVDAALNPQPPVQILAQNFRRKNATIRLYGDAATQVIVGTREQCMTVLNVATPTIGYLLGLGNSGGTVELRYSGAGDLFMVPYLGDGYVTVMDEQYR